MTVGMRAGIVRSHGDVRRSGQKLLLPTLPLTGRWRFSGLILGMFLEFLRFFMGESERTVVEPHERLAWIRHPGRCAREVGIQFTAFIGVRNTLIVTVGVSGYTEG